MILLLLLLLLFPAAASATVLSDAAAALSPGQFAVVTGMINLQATAAAYDPGPASPGPGYDGGQPAWDPLARKLYIEMTEHGDASACPQNFPNFPHWCWKPLWTYDDSTDTWATNGPYPAYTSGGGPVSGVHTWGYTAWDNTNKTIYVRGHDTNIGGFWWSVFRYCASNSPASYCASQLGQWNQITGFNPPSGSQVGTSLGWMPTRGGGTLLAFDTDGNNAGCGALFGMTYVSGTATWGTVDSGAGCKYVFAATTLNRIIYSPQKDVAIFGPTEANGLKWWRIGPTGATVALDNAPCAFHTTDDGFSQTSEDPTTGDIIFIGCTQVGQMWRLNPTAASGSQWTQMHATLDAPGQICNVRRTMSASNLRCGFDFVSSPISTYGVIGFWKMRLGVSGGIGSHQQAAEYWIYKPSATSGDTTPPTVSVTAPSGGATVSTTVTLSATAADNIGVAGVQFKVDGTSVGSEDTTSPYSISWDSTTVANGTHSITAVARDAAGNGTTSSAVSVTVTNAGGGSDFTTRCALPGTLVCVGFETSDVDFSKRWGDPRGVSQIAQVGATQWSDPVLDTAQKASGNSSIKMTIPANSGPDTSGSYWANFSNDYLTQISGNGTITIQWRQRFSSCFLYQGTAEPCTGALRSYAGADGWKQAIISAGDKPGCNPGTAVGGGPCYSSCTEIETVPVNEAHYGFAQIYHTCPSPFTTSSRVDLPGGDFNLQNGMPSPFCLYSQGSGSGRFPPTGNCFAYVPNEWMTFKIRITTGPRVTKGTDDFLTNSTVEMWIAREGQPSVRAINWGPTDLYAGPTSDNQKIGKVFLIPYNSKKDSTQTNPVAYTWYDELIISTNDIPDPSAGTAPHVFVPVNFKIQ